MPCGVGVFCKSEGFHLSQTPCLPLWRMENSCFAFFAFSSRIMADTAWSSGGPRGKWDSEPLSLTPGDQDPLRINSTDPFSWKVSLTVT